MTQTSQITACGPNCDRQHSELEPHNDNLARPVFVTPESGSRLEQLHAAYVDAKAQADEAAKRLKAVTDGIKAELTGAHPDAAKLTLTGEAGPALGLTYASRVTLDSKRLKQENPLIYVTYAKFGGAWTLRPVGSGGDE